MGSRRRLTSVVVAVAVAGAGLVGITPATSAAPSATSGPVTTVAASAAAAPARYERYYRYMDTGRSRIPWSDTKWVPQGLAKNGSTENELLISYYDSSGRENSRIAVIDRVSGKYKRYYKLPHRGHVGGLATTHQYVWVTYGGELQRYARTEFTRPSGSTIRFTYQQNVAGYASYAYGSGNEVWVGNFNWGPGKTCPTKRVANDKMYRYVVTSTGALAHRETRVTPSKVQGVAMDGTKIVWSQSCGRKNDSKLIVWPRNRTYDGDFRYGSAITAPNMSEGMVIAGGELQVVFEAASAYYSDATYRIRSVHHGRFSSLPL